VVGIHEIGEAGGMPYLCLEYIPGGNLERKLHERLPSARESAEIVRQLAEAIQAAHDREIIHRDLKPANVLCDYAAPRPKGDDSGHGPTIPALNVKLTDFGLARIVHEANDQTRPGFAVGTPSFMSPEQASGKPEEVGKSTDIYGLGAILYDLLTGAPPFSGETAAETMRMVRMEAPVPPGQRNSRVPRDLERICLRCLEKEPADRYATAAELAADLRRFLMERSVEAFPLRSIRKFWRRCRRHRFYSLSLLAITILTIAVGLRFR
jgi:serine/threonine-protein kinase